MLLRRRIKSLLTERPDTPSIEFEGRWYPRSHSAAIAFRLGAILGPLGLPEGTPVGLVLRNRPAHLGAFFSLFAAGNWVALISPHQSAEALAAEISRITLPVLLLDREDWSPQVAAAVEATGALALSIRDGDPVSIEIVSTLRQPGPGPHRPAQAGMAIELLTSGTSGQPKRYPYSHATLDIAIPHQVEFSRGMGEAPPSDADEAVMLHVSPLATISGMWSALQMGHDHRRLVLFEKFDVESWRRALVRYRPRMLGLLPAMLRMLLDADPPKGEFASLRAIRVGAAPLDVATLRRVEEDYGVPILMIYGATEYAGPFACWSLDLHRQWRGRKDHSKDASTGKIHRDKADVRIVDPDSGRELGVNEVGRLEVRLARVGPQWITTNDLASIDEDDFLYIQGRADDAINRGGFKIPPETIADALRKHPGVRDAAVVGIPDARLGQVPAAAVEPRSGVTLSTDELAQFAREQLIAYQVPARFLIVESLPRTAIGKVQRARVQALFE